ncbi:MAG: TetR family transcriptional regulator C-terminal domain-containing protein [Pseudoxanthomonas sp.]
MLSQIHDQAVTDWIARVQAAVGDASGIEALDRIIDALRGFMEEQPDEVRAMYLLRYASIDPGAEFRANVAKSHLAQRRDVQRRIEQGQKNGSIPTGLDAALSAEMFCATVDGLIYRWLVNPSLPIQKLHDLLKQQVAVLYAVTPEAPAKARKTTTKRSKPR